MKTQYKLLITTQYNDNIVKTRSQVYDNINQALLMESIYRKNKQRELNRNMIKQYNTRIVYL